MVYYQKMGEIPSKRHTTFKKADGSLYREQVMGTKGFSGIQSILYHHHFPTAVTEATFIKSTAPEYEAESALRHRHFRTAQYDKKGDAIVERCYFLGNEDVILGVVNPTKPMDYFYRNGDGDELFFIHHGTGKIESMFGELSYKPGDYIVMPIGTIYRVIPDGEDNRWLVLEANSAITTPRRYRNEHGQLMEHSPFCERDINGPESLLSSDQKGSFDVMTKTRGGLHRHVFDHHPLDVVGWDGYLYPWKFNINDFEPITGRVHQPPPVHQTFEGHNFVVCSFVPRLYDYHPDAIPAPYFHSNVDSDEVLYYVEGNFMSRKGIEEASITLHPSGIPHGPHPGKIEASIGKKETLELAVMIDTFRPLKVIEQVQQYEDANYMKSWVTE